MENDFENRLQAALDACVRMQDQRDQLTAQLKDATVQCGAMAEVLRDAFAYIDDDQEYSIETGKPLPDNCASLLSRIDAALAGIIPGPAVPEAAVINNPYVLAAPADELTEDEIALLAWACNCPGCKNENVAWGNEKEGVSHQLWEKLEKLGLIECVGSYKWAATDKGRAKLAASTKLEGGA